MAPQSRSSSTDSKKTKKSAAGSLEKGSMKKKGAKKSAAKKAATKKAASGSKRTKAISRAKPTAAAVEVDGDVLEFIAAIDEYKNAHERPFPSWSEILHIVKALGYSK